MNNLTDISVHRQTRLEPKKTQHRNIQYIPPVTLPFIDSKNYSDQDLIELKRILFYFSQTPTGYHDLSNIQPTLSFLDDHELLHHNFPNRNILIIQPHSKKNPVNITEEIEKYYLIKTKFIAICNQHVFHSLPFFFGQARALRFHACTKIILMAAELILGFESPLGQENQKPFKSAYLLNFIQSDFYLQQTFYKLLTLHRAKHDFLPGKITNQMAATIFKSFFEQQATIDVFDNSLLKYAKANKRHWEFDSNPQSYEDGLKAIAPFLKIKGQSYLIQNHIDLTNPLYCGITPEQQMFFQRGMSVKSGRISRKEIFSVGAQQRQDQPINQSLVTHTLNGILNSATIKDPKVEVDFLDFVIKRTYRFFNKLGSEPHQVSRLSTPTPIK